MFVKSLLILSMVVAYASADCLHCICMRESGCKPIGCNMDVGSLSCGYYQIKLPYYEDCGTPDRKSGENLEEAWKRCANNLSCATKCVENYYNRYKSQCNGLGMGACQVMSRNHNGGPRGCHSSGTVGYWNGIHKCCGCA